MNISLLDPLRGFPIVIRPNDSQPKTVFALRTWITTESVLIERLRLFAGALLFRGFDVRRAEDFEAISLALEGKLNNVYLGTSPRNPIGNTSFVFSASEFPGIIVIPHHCEMSFLSTPPRSILFYAHRPNALPGGETPLSDFRGVWEDMDGGLREALQTVGNFVNIRAYHSANRWNFNPFQTKTWQEMFNTTDKSIALQRAHAEGFEASFTPRDTILLENTSPITRPHPVTGRQTWHNHLQVFDARSIEDEYAIAVARVNSYLAVFGRWITAAIVRFNILLHGEQGIGQIAMFPNHTAIPQATIDHIRGLVWKHAVVYAHEQGDVVFLDNFRIAHARQPYSGDRKVYVTWSASNAD